MLTKTRYPGLSVTLFKNVGRKKLSGSGANALPVSTRFSGQQSILDVTQYIGEHGAVHVNKSVRAPAGVFSIDFTDQLVQQEDDSIYGLFEPMDVVEIRMAANSFAGPLPIMMRGFISAVTRSQAMGQDGRPTRKVVVSGQDYGKIWQIYNIYYNPWMPNNENYITQFKLFTRFGIAFKTQAAGALVSSIFDTILNPFIQTMGAKAAAGTSGGTSPLVPFKKDIQIQDGSVSPFGVNDWQGGSIYALLQSFCDVGVWNELFIEDRKDGPYVVFRPNPFIKAGGDPSNQGSYINSHSKLATVVKIDSTLVVSIEVTRSDANVANYFWVESPQYDLNFAFVGKAMAASGGSASTFIITNYGNNDPALYGLKRMADQTNQGAFDQVGAGGTDKTTNLQDASASSSWIGQRRALLVAQNRDNIVFESGTMRLIGNENIKAGVYISLTHGNMVSSYYVVSASHAYTPFGNYFTTVNFERGTGFIDRAQKGTGTDSPYWAELADAQS